MKSIQNCEIETKHDPYIEFYLFPINVGEYAFKNLIFKINETK